MSKPTFAMLAPIAIDEVKLSKLHIKTEDLEKLWAITGATSEKNLVKLPLWKVICIAYLEGLHHGAGVEREKHDLKTCS